MMIGQSILELTGVSFNWLMILLGLIAFSSIIVDLSAELFKYIKIFKEFLKNVEKRDCQKVKDFP